MQFQTTEKLLLTEADEEGVGKALAKRARSDQIVAGKFRATFGSHFRQSLPVNLTGKERAI